MCPFPFFLLALRCLLLLVEVVDAALEGGVDQGAGGSTRLQR